MRPFGIVALALLASPVAAQEGMYVGLGLGRFDYDEDAAFLAPRRFADEVSSWRVYGGFAINEHFGFEVRYGATEEIVQTFSGTNATLGDFTSTFDMDFKTTSVAAVGFLPQGWGALFGGIGFYDLETGADFELTAECCGNIADSITVGDDGLMAVIGVEWRFGRFGTGVGLRLEYEWLDIDAAAASTVGIGAAYRF